MECGHNNQVSTLGFFIFYVSGHWTVDRDSAAQSSQMLNNKELEHGDRKTKRIYFHSHIAKISTILHLFLTGRMFLCSRYQSQPLDTTAQ